MAFSVVASASHTHQHMDRLDAARALLGVSPTTDSSSTSSPETITLPRPSSKTASASILSPAKTAISENEDHSSEISSQLSKVVISNPVVPMQSSIDPRTTLTTTTAAVGTTISSITRETLSSPPAAAAAGATTTPETTASTVLSGITHGKFSSRTVPLANDQAAGAPPPLAPPPVLPPSPSANNNATISSFLRLAEPNKSKTGLSGLDALAALASEEQANMMAEKQQQQQQQQRQPQQQKQEIKVRLVAPAKISFSKQPLVPSASTPFAVATAGNAAAGSPPFIAATIAAAASPPFVVASSSSKVVSTLSSSSDDDSEAMPPPPPRCTAGRRRSVSNPEGMEKWDPFSRNSSRSYRRHFVLPASILEEELAEANAAVSRQEQGIAEENDDREQQEENFSSYHQPLPPKKRLLQQHHQQQQKREPKAGIISINSDVDSSATSSFSEVGATKKNIEKNEIVPPRCVKDNEECVSPDEMLRRARSRLLEDLSEGSLNGDKGVLTLPHSLSKYKEVYNKNGRIGIYTPAERAAIIARFNTKRSRRVWNKKIRYNCRKNLADRRMRVKGRFVKRSAELQPATAAVVVKKQTPPALPFPPPATASNTRTFVVSGAADTKINSTIPSTNFATTAAEAIIAMPTSVVNNNIKNHNNRSITAITALLPPTPEAINENDDDDDNDALPPDEDMPDVNDPDAGFAPTEDQPYRRLRRHTIT